MQISMLSAIIIAVGLIGARVSANDRLLFDDDFDDDHWSPDQSIRLKRAPDYGGVGGALAAESHVTEGPVVAPKATKPGKPAKEIDQCKSRPSDTDKKKSIKCEFVEKKQQAVEAIQTGKDKAPDYKFLGVVTCDKESKCREYCSREGCNYYMRSIMKDKLDLAYLYLIDDKKLASAEYVQANGFISYEKSCTSESSDSKDEDHKARRRSRRQNPACDWCYASTFNCLNPCGVCDFFCKGGGLAAILGVAIGVPVAVGAGVGGGLSAASGASAAAGQQSQTATSASQVQTFQQFQNFYEKSYSSSQQQQQAEQQMQQNKQKIDQSNQQCRGDDARQSFTKFSDLSSLAFLAAFTGALVDFPPPTPLDFDPTEYPDEPPTILHWERNNVLPPVRYQGECGACYAFATADLVSSMHHLERNIYRRTGDNAQPLSVQYVVDCGSDDAALGCKGGRPYLAVKDLETAGIPYESCYKYKEKSSKCQPKTASQCCYRTRVKYSDYISIDEKDEMVAMARLLSWGPVMTVISANDAWQFYNGTGIIKARQCKGAKQNHAVLITGYEFNSKSPYYVIRNSWGEDWGDGGYAKLEAGKNACGVINNVVVACTGDCRNVTSVKDLMARPNVKPVKVTKLKDKTVRRSNERDDNSRKSNDRHRNQKQQPKRSRNSRP